MSFPGSESWPERSDRFESDRPKPRKEMFPKRAVATLGFLADSMRRRKSGRLTLWVIVVLLALGGVGMMSYPFATHIWAKRIQSGLRNDFTHKFGSQQAIDAYRSRQIRPGEALTRLKIPTLGVNVIVVEGTTGNALRAGAGHYPESPLPGEPGNVSIAGHRTGFGEPFRHVDRMRAGDQAILETPIGRYTYEVVPEFDGHRNPWITFPTDFSVIAPTVDASLTLTTCDPPHTSKNRLIVRLKLVKSEVGV